MRLGPQNRCQIVLCFPWQAGPPVGDTAAVQGGLYCPCSAVISSQSHGIVPTVGWDIRGHEVSCGLERGRRIPGIDAESCGGGGLELGNALGTSGGNGFGIEMA